MIMCPNIQDRHIGAVDKRGFSFWAVDVMWVSGNSKWLVQIIWNRIQADVTINLFTFSPRYELHYQIIKNKNTQHNSRPKTMMGHETPDTSSSSHDSEYAPEHHANRPCPWANSNLTTRPARNCEAQAGEPLFQQSRLAIAIKQGGRNSLTVDAVTVQEKRNRACAGKKQVYYRHYHKSHVSKTSRKAEWKAQQKHWWEAAAECTQGTLNQNQKPMTDFIQRTVYLLHYM